MHDLAAAESPGEGAPGEGWKSLFRAVLQNARNPMALVDEDRRIVEVNPSATALTGFARSQLIGRAADDFVPDHEKEGFDREWRQLLLTGDGNAEREMLCADGGRVTIQYRASRSIVGERRLVLYLATQVRPALEAAQPTAIRSYSFSPREQEIVRLVAQGLTTRDIADQLRLSLETVRTHIRNAMGKLSARTRAQLVAKALQERLI